MTEHILINEDDRGVVTLTINRPNKGNAFTAEMIDQLILYVQELQTSKSARLVIIMSIGDHFCTGADLAWMKSSFTLNESDNRIDAKRLADLYDALFTLSIPTLSMVHGAVFGGGLGIVACSDIVIAANNAKFCFSEVKLGLAPATISPYVVNAIGPRAALYHFIVADQFPAEEALRVGLVNKIVEIEDLEASTQEIVDNILANDHTAVFHSKHLVRSISPIDEGLIEDTIDLIAKLRQSPNAQKRLEKFLK